MPPSNFFAAQWFATAWLFTETIALSSQQVTFAGDAWLGYVPLRMPDTVCVQERLPPGAAGVLINQTHAYTGSDHANRFNREAVVRCH